jgi:class 3 adenylate cyclase/tetratricopeptide (TPR) repeat protein
MAATPGEKPRGPVAGTLSVLFADLRDYTAFVEAHGDAAASALIADYRRLVRAQVAQAGGGEIKTEGDSFFVVFPTARQALQAGIGILREATLQARSRPDRPLRIGVGIHAGEPVAHEGDYIGSAVNVAARLAQEAGAGELLVSEVVRGLLRTSGGPPMQEREGLVLKGIADAPRVYAVKVEPASSAAHRETGKPPAASLVAIEAEPPTDRRILCPDLIGRERELHSLDTWLREATGGHGKTVLLGGEAGLGKSATLRAFAERARAAGARVFVGECTEIEARQPFGPFVEVGSAAVQELSGEDGGASRGAGAAELLGIGPGRLTAWGPEPMDEGERYRVHAAFAQLLGDLARRGPLVIAIEDLHWADEATLELFPYLARKLRPFPVLLLGTYRSDELHRLHPLNHLLAELARGRLSEELRLRRLSPEETGALVQAALSLARPVTAAFRAALQDRCEGNPFFLEEVLRALVERGDLYYRDGAWHRAKDVPQLAIPVSIRDAVQQHMRLLPADVLRVMHVAAVIGQRFDFELLRRVSGLSEAALLEALRAALEAQLIEEESTGEGEERYLFRHALTRESVLAELLQRERRLLHRAVGEAIEATAGGKATEHAEQLAYHFEQARDQERALRYHELAAREASRVFAFARVLQHLERAVEMAPDEDPALGELQLRLAEAAYNASDLPRALRAATEAQRLFTAAGDARHAGAALSRLSRYRWMLGDTKAAADLAADALRLLEPLGDSAELAAAYGQRAALAMLDHRNAEAVDWGQRAIEMAHRTGASEVRVVALNTVGAAMSRSDPAGLALIRESLELALKHDLVFEAQRAYNNLAVSMARIGVAQPEIRRVHDERVQHARRFGLRPEVLIAAMGYVAWLDGDWDEALRLVEEGRGDTIWSAGGELFEAFMITARHGPERGRPLLEGPRRRLLAAGDAQWVVSAGTRSVWTLLLLDDFSATLEYAGLAMEVVRDHPSAGGGQVTIGAIVAARALGDEAAAARWIELGLARPDAPVPHGERGGVAFARGERAARQGDLDAAIASLRESVHASSEFVPVASHWPRLRLTELLLARGAPGDREAAQAELDAILPYWRKAKASWYLGRLKAWAGERGLTVADA